MLTCSDGSLQEWAAWAAHRAPTNRINQATSYPELGPESQPAAEAAVINSYFLVIARTWENQEWHLGSHPHYFKSCKTGKVSPGLRQTLSHTLLPWGDQGKDHQPSVKVTSFPLLSKQEDSVITWFTRAEPGPSQILASIFRTLNA